MLVLRTVFAPVIATSLSLEPTSLPMKKIVPAFKVPLVICHVLI